MDEELLSSIRILVVDDYRPFRQWVCSTLGKKPELQVVGEASDGLEAVQKAVELKPDLILLDLGLPKLNGIEAARRIRKLSPESKILFVSQQSSADIVQEALISGALGFVVKAHAGTELLTGVEAVLQGKQFVSIGLASHNFTNPTDAQVRDRPRLQEALLSLAPKKVETTRNHEVQFYSDDVSFLVSLTSFIEAALRAGNAVIVVATESHRNSLLQRLQAHRVDVSSAIEQGRFIHLDAAETLSTFMESGGPNRERFLSALGPLIRNAEAAAQATPKRVVLFGEMVALLCAEGNINAAIKLEQLWNEMAQTSFLYLRCAYPMTDELKDEPYAAICAEHSAVFPSET
jgi:DNA-binding NarL/FixJ family response regulator